MPLNAQSESGKDDALKARVQLEVRENMYPVSETINAATAAGAKPQPKLATSKNIPTPANN